MNDISNIINQIINNFDFSYMIVVNALTYLIIKLIDKLNGEAPVSRCTKRIILIICIILLAGVYVIIGYENKIILLNSAILAPVSWKFLFKPLVKKFKLDYAK